MIQNDNIYFTNAEVEAYSKNAFFTKKISSKVKESIDQHAILPHRHPYQEILWYTSAAGTFSLDGVDYEIKDNTLLYVSAGQVHRVYREHENMEYEAYVLKFYDHFLDTRSETLNVFNNIANDSIIYVEGDAVDRFNRVMQMMYEEYACRDCDGAYDMLRNLLNMLLIMIARQRKHSFEKRVNVSDPSYTILDKFLRLLEERYSSSHNVNDYADILNISTRKLGEVMKRFLGKTTNDVITERVITEAKRLLLYSDSSVKEISFSVGFEDPSYFGKVFKKVTGVTPADFRK